MTMDQPRQPKGVPAGGEFVTGPKGENGDLDYEPDCALCGSPIQYCQGHGEWNNYEEMRPAEVQVGDRVWNAAAAAGQMVIKEPRKRFHRVSLLTKEGEMQFPEDATVYVLPQEDEYRPAETADQDQSIRICPRGADCKVKSCKKWHPTAPLVETDPASLQPEDPAPADIDDAEENDQAMWGPGYGPDPADVDPRAYGRAQDAYDNSVYGR